MLKFFERKRVISLILTLIIASAIFYISSLSFKGASVGVLSIFYHFLAFFWLAFFLSLTIIAGKKKNPLFLAVILAVIYAISDELHQFFIPYRNASFSDVLIDSAGILFANFLYFLSFKKKQSSNIHGFPQYTGKNNGKNKIKPKPR